MKIASEWAKLEDALCTREEVPSVPVTLLAVVYIDEVSPVKMQVVVREARASEP